MSIKFYVNNLKNSLNVFDKYNNDFEEISNLINLTLNKDKGNIYILTAGAVADLMNAFIRGLQFYFKYEFDRLKVIKASINNNFDFEKEKIEKESVFSIGVLSAIETNLTKDDIVIALSATGRTDFINGFIKEAKNFDSKLIYIVSNSNLKEIEKLNVDYKIIIELKNKFVHGIYTGSHTTFLKIAIEKILFRVFELKGQIVDGYVLTTNCWTKKLRENSLETIAKYGKELSYLDSIKLFENSNNELSTIISSLILNVDFNEAKKRIEKVNYNFNKLK